MRSLLSALWWSRRNSLIGSLLVIVGLLFGFSHLALSREQTQGLQNEQDLKAYPSYDTLYSNLRALQQKYSGIMQLVVVAHSHGDDGDVNKTADNRDIIAVKISDRVYLENDGMPQEEADLLFVGGQHAREWIAVEVPFLLIKYLVENYGKDKKITDLVDNSEIWIIPLDNPDGYEFTRNDDRLWRKNRRNNGDGAFGVDLNRNFPYELGIDWNKPLPPGSLTSLDSASELYRGPNPLSEPESQAIRDLVASHHFQAAINFHSYGQTILYPWGISDADAKDETLFENISNKMAQLIQAVHGTVYRPSKSFNSEDSSGGAYLKHGELSDWLYGQGILSFTVELSPRTYAEGGFELPADKIQSTFQDFLPAALYLIQAGIERSPKTPASGITRTLDEALDLNGNHFLDDNELLLLVDYWISSEVVPGTGQIVDDDKFFYYVDKWMSKKRLTPDQPPQERVALMLDRTRITYQKSGLRLEVVGAGIAEIDFQLFNLAGQRLMRRLVPGSELEFSPFDVAGSRLANGVYLYRVIAYGARGEAIQSQVRKFVILK
jgi:carboxypeptidase T